MARGRSDGATAWSFAPQPHLPPKIPVFSGSGSSTLDYSSSSNSNSNSSFFTNWPSLSHQIEGRSSRPRHHRTPSTSFLPQTPDWIDDLLNDSPADVAPAHAKSLHRRSSSDSFAFLEAPSQHARITNSAEEEESVGKRLDVASKGLDTFNEEQLMSMFAGMRLLQDSHTANHTTSFDHGFSNPQLLDDQRGRGFEQSRNDIKVHSALLSAAGKGEPASTTIWLVDPSLDSKQAKRSAQRSRVRKMEYISQLEMAKDFFEKQVSTLSSQVADMEHHRIILNGDNDSIKQRLTTLLQKKLFTDAQNEVLKEEVHRLRHLQHQ